MLVKCTSLKLTAAFNHQQNDRVWPLDVFRGKAFDKTDPLGVSAFDDAYMSTTERVVNGGRPLKLTRQVIQIQSW